MRKLYLWLRKCVTWLKTRLLRKAITEKIVVPEPRKLSNKKKDLFKRLARWITSSPNYCVVCKKPLHRDSRQIMYYCSTVCRRRGRGGKKNRKLLTREA